MNAVLEAALGDASRGRVVFPMKPDTIGTGGKAYRREDPEGLFPPAPAPDWLLAKAPKPKISERAVAADGQPVESSHLEHDAISSAHAVMPGGAGHPRLSGIIERDVKVVDTRAKARA